AALRPVPAALVRYARTRDVYSSVYSDVDVPVRGVVHPFWQALQDLLWADVQPRALATDLLRRRMAAVYPFPGQLDTSAGKGEAGYLWKLNEVLRAKYRPDPASPYVIVDRGLAARAFLPVPGPDPAPWIDKCFAPFRLGGRSFR